MNSFISAQKKSKKQSKASFLLHKLREAIAARASSVECERILRAHRPSFSLEALEPRLLLSADSVVNLSAAADTVSIVQTGLSADGGAILNLTVNAVMTAYGDATTGVSSLTLNALGGNDSITLGSGITAKLVIDGGTGSDSITGPNQDTDWIISGVNNGAFGEMNSFTNVESLAGGSGDDNFKFETFCALAGSISGGGGFGVNTVFSADTDNVWAINAANAGSLNGNLFSAVSNLAGGQGVDSFDFTLAGAISGIIDGGDDDSQLVTPVVDRLNFSGLNSAVDVDLAAAAVSGRVGVFSRIDSLVGSSSVSDTLLGYDSSSVRWTIDGSNSGNVEGLLFSSFENLTGVSSSTSDAFTFEVGGSLSGILAGGSSTYDSFEVADGLGGFTTTDSLAFAVPADTLTIEGRDGNDSIEVKSLDSLFAADLLLYGSSLNSHGVPIDAIYSDTITFSGSINTGGGTLDAWAANIVVSNSVNIDVGGGYINFRSRDIGIAEVENLSPVFGTDRSVSIIIGQGAVLSSEGGIFLIAQAEDQNLATVLGASKEVDNYIIQPLADQVAGLTALPVKLLVKNSSATITLQTGAKLLSDSTVGVYANAGTDGSGSASSSLISLGYARAVSTATIDIQANVEILSRDASVVITTSGEATANLSSSTSKDLSSTPNPGGSAAQFALAIAVSDANVTSHITVAAGTTITAGKTANVIAGGDISSEAEAETGLFADGTAGLAFALQFSNADIKTVMNGSVTALAKPGYTVKIEIDPLETNPDNVGYVDYANNMIHVGAHALVTEDVITYTNRYGTSIGNLRDGDSYYVIALEDDLSTLDRDESEWIMLAETETQAIKASLGFTDVADGNVVNLTVLSGLETANNGRVFVGSDIDADASSITLRDSANSPSNFNKFELGQAVVYHDDGVNHIDGLVDGNTYYVIVGTSQNNLQGDTRFATGQVIQLAESENEARAGVFIDIGSSAEDRKS